eukprot:GDKH01026699.1.p1 GENE.GDKH01026699.1~~GDKH01026699.1.p1  ORF type:complete len:56 (+),score=0.78 GDKH01026699.1:1-168(+)
MKTSDVCVSISLRLDDGTRTQYVNTVFAIVIALPVCPHPRPSHILMCDAPSNFSM